MYDFETMSKKLSQHTLDKLNDEIVEHIARGDLKIETIGDKDLLVRDAVSGEVTFAREVKLVIPALARVKELEEQLALYKK